MFAAANPVSFFDNGHRPVCDVEEWKCAGASSRGSIGSSSGDFRAADSATMGNSESFVPPYRGQGGDDWYVDFVGLGTDRSGEGKLSRYSAFLDGISMTFVAQEAEILQASPGASTSMRRLRTPSTNSRSTMSSNARAAVTHATST